MGGELETPSTVSALSMTEMHLGFKFFLKPNSLKFSPKREICVALRTHLNFLGYRLILGGPGVCKSSRLTISLNSPAGTVAAVQTGRTRGDVAQFNEKKNKRNQKIIETWYDLMKTKNKKNKKI